MTPAPWFTWQDPFEKYWRIDHRLPDNTIIVGMIGREDNARLVAAAPEMLDALLELCKVVGAHPDSMTDGAPLNAAFVKAAEVVQKASPPPQPLRNVIEVPFPQSAASHADNKEK